jgi:tellurite resistance protein TehA-like permease
MRYTNWLIKYMTPLLLVSYTCTLMAATMIVRGQTGFGLPFIEFLIFFALCLLLFDFILKKLLKKNIRRLIWIEVAISLILLIASLYIECRKSKHAPVNINVESV